MRDQYDRAFYFDHLPRTIFLTTGHVSVVNGVRRYVLWDTVTWCDQIHYRYDHPIYSIQIKWPGLYKISCSMGIIRTSGTISTFRLFAELNGTLVPGSQRSTYLAATEGLEVGVQSVSVVDVKEPNSEIKISIQRIAGNMEAVTDASEMSFLLERLDRSHLQTE